MSLFANVSPICGITKRSEIGYAQFLPKESARTNQQRTALDQIR
jgi:hypothetical protein